MRTYLWTDQSTIRSRTGEAVVTYRGPRMGRGCTREWYLYPVSA